MVTAAGNRYLAAVDMNVSSLTPCRGWPRFSWKEPFEKQKRGGAPVLQSIVSVTHAHAHALMMTVATSCPIHSETFTHIANQPTKMKVLSQVVSAVVKLSGSTQFGIHLSWRVHVTWKLPNLATLLSLQTSSTLRICQIQRQASWLISLAHMPISLQHANHSKRQPPPRAHLLPPLLPAGSPERQEALLFHRRQPWRCTAQAARQQPERSCFTSWRSSLHGRRYWPRD